MKSSRSTEGRMRATFSWKLTASTSRPCGARRSRRRCERRHLGHDGRTRSPRVIMTTRPRSPPPPFAAVDVLQRQRRRGPPVHGSRCPRRRRAAHAADNATSSATARPGGDRHGGPRSSMVRRRRAGFDGRAWLGQTRAAARAVGVPGRSAPCCAGKLATEGIFHTPGFASSVATAELDRSKAELVVGCARGRRRFRPSTSTTPSAARSTARSASCPSTTRRAPSGRSSPGIARRSPGPSAAAGSSSTSAPATAPRRGRGCRSSRRRATSPSTSPGRHRRGAGDHGAGISRRRDDRRRHRLHAAWTSATTSPPARVVPVTFFYPGSSIGNFDPDDALARSSPPFVATASRTPAAAC